MRTLGIEPSLQAQGRRDLRSENCWSRVECLNCVESRVCLNCVGVESCSEKPQGCREEANKGARDPDRSGDAITESLRGALQVWVPEAEPSIPTGPTDPTISVAAGRSSAMLATETEKPPRQVCFELVPSSLNWCSRLCHDGERMACRSRADGWQVALQGEMTSFLSPTLHPSAHDWVHLKVHATVSVIIRRSIFSSTARQCGLPRFGMILCG